MKLVIVNTLYTPNLIGGAERSVQFLAEALVKEGHEVAVVSTRAQSGTHQDVVNGVKVYYVGLKNLYWPFDSGKLEPLKPLWHGIDTYNPPMARAVADVLDAEQPDLVHTNNIAGFSVAVWQTVKARGLPLVHTLRDYYLLCPRTSMFRDGSNCEKQCWDCRLYSTLRQRESNKVDALIGNSGFILHKHLELGCFRNVIYKNTIYNGYGAGEPVADKGRRERLKLGYIGRLSPTKGVDLVLKTLKNSLVDDAELYIAGEGEETYETYLKDTYPFPAVHYLGFVKPEKLFAQINVLLVPSLWHEPLPRTVFEAYAHGVPVIGSNRGGIPEIIDEGETGFLFEPDQPKSLEEAVKRFFEDPELLTKMRPNLLAKANTFLPKTIVGRHLDVYRSVLAG